MAHFPFHSNPKHSLTRSTRALLEETYKKHLIRTDADIKDIPNILYSATAGNLFDENM